ncbi:MAG: hypothetical protein ACQKBV_05140 [Puniceicoccales bacterium]
MFRKQLLLFIVTLIAASGLLRAQSPTGGTSFLDIISAQQELGFTISQNFEYAFASDLQENYNGDLGAARYTTGIDYATNWNRGFWRAGVSYEYNDWQWGGPEYFGDTTEINFNTIFGQRFLDSDWGLVAVLGASLGAENNGGNFGRGGSYRAGLALTYYWGDWNSFSFGAMAIGQEESDMYVLPLPILNWQITDRLNLRTFNGFTLSYDVMGDNSTSVDLTSEYESDLFRLKTRPSNPLVTGTFTSTPTVEKEAVVVATGITHRFTEMFYIRGYVEGIVYRKFEFRENHSTFRTIKTDPTIALGFQGGINF